MWDYIYFVGLNTGAFVVAMIFWHFVPKPLPYDATTIPGLKPPQAELEALGTLPQSPDAPLDATGRRGNLEDIAAAGSWEGFVEELGSVFGPLSSFYWGQRYVVLLHGWEDACDLLSAYDSDHFEIRRDFVAAMAGFGQVEKESAMKAAQLVAKTLRISSGKSDFCEKLIDCVELAKCKNIRNMESKQILRGIGGNTESSWPIVSQRDLCCSILVEALGQHETKPFHSVWEASDYISSHVRTIGLRSENVTDIRGYQVPARIPILLYLPTQHKTLQNETRAHGWIASVKAALGQDKLEEAFISIQRHLNGDLL